MEINDPLQTIRIILVEDSEHDQAAFERALKKSSIECEITMCAMPEKALNLLLEHPQDYDLAVVDHKLPGMSGMELFRKISEKKGLPPFVMLTGKGNENLAVEALKEGFFDYIVKDTEGWYLDLLPLVLPDVVRRYRDQQARKWVEIAMRKAYEEMEQRIQERTSELLEMNREMVQEIRQRKKAQKALEKSERKLRHLSQKLMEAQESERRLVSQEIHDSIGSGLVAIKFAIQNKSEEIRKILGVDKSPLEDVINLVLNTIQDARRIITNLRPSILDDLGLLPTLDWWRREFTEVYSHIGVEKDIRVAEHDVPEQLKTVIYRILQEASTNTARHSGADTFFLQLEKEGIYLLFTLTDNGKGFDPASVHGAEGFSSGLGLMGMKERAELSGGELTIETAPGKGTKVISRWPLS